MCLSPAEAGVFQWATGAQPIECVRREVEGLWNVGGRPSFHPLWPWGCMFPPVQNPPLWASRRTPLYLTKPFMMLLFLLDSKYPL